jgi:phosphate transport system protein
MGEHIHRAFDEDLDKLAGMVKAMGDLVQQRLDRVGGALERMDAEEAKAMAQEIVEGDDAVDIMDHDVDAFTLKLLALREPKALDLRAVIGAQKIASDLERISDYCNGLVRQVEHMSGVNLDPFAPAITKMMVTARSMLAMVLEASTERSVEKALRVWHRDDELNDLYGEVITALQEAMEGEGGHAAYASLLLTARYLERIGDHVSNIAEHVYFQVLGERFPGHK